MNTKVLLILVAIFFLFNACQEEEKIIVQDTSTNLNRNSSLTTLLERVSQNNTAIDNVIDQTSAFRINFPYQITVNNQTLTIDSVTDYPVVETIINQSNSDNDIISFTYPITISFRDYSSRIITTLNGLEMAKNEGEDFSEIDCFSFIFPVNITLYDTNNQIGNVITIDGDEEFADFLINLQGDVFFIINYPITITNQNGNNQVIATNDQLEIAISTATTVCGANNGDPDGLEEILLQDNWFISLYQDDDDDDDDTDEFQGYTFTFNQDNSVSVNIDNIISSGTWQIINDGNTVKLDLTFTDPNLQSLINDWEILEFSSSFIRLKNDNNDEFLNFSKL
jgi:hypothetical protein